MEGTASVLSLESALQGETHSPTQPSEASRRTPEKGPKLFAALGRAGGMMPQWK
ncbi:hypothetical protein E2I00_012734 [Balaenoptera physalus]|uniref:Uncharacterized protein n=1 Tax=Balaenoptera physalus TaxID=9770 RepID=A0A6A1QD20_BALPH|nr:hypothetical protein E2I00_012734 [Balaenoptera physalus]